MYWFSIYWLYWVINESHTGYWMLLRPRYTMEFAFLEKSLDFCIGPAWFEYLLACFLQKKYYIKGQNSHTLFFTPLRKSFCYYDYLIIFQYHSKDLLFLCNVPCQSLSRPHSLLNLTCVEFVNEALRWQILLPCLIFECHLERSIN